MKPILKSSAFVLLVWEIVFTSFNTETPGNHLFYSTSPARNITVYEFLNVPQVPVFEDMGAYWRRSTVSYPITEVNVNQNTMKVFVKWNNTMGWESLPVCGVSCTIVDRYATVVNDKVNAYLRADPFYPTGSAEDSIAVKLIL